MDALAVDPRALADLAMKWYRCREADCAELAGLTEALEEQLRRVVALFAECAWLKSAPSGTCVSRTARTIAQQCSRSLSGSFDGGSFLGTLYESLDRLMKPHQSNGKWFEPRLDEHLRSEEAFARFRQDPLLVVFKCLQDHLPALKRAQMREVEHRGQIGGGGREVPVDPAQAPAPDAKGHLQRQRERRSRSARSKRVHLIDHCEWFESHIAEGADPPAVPLADLGLALLRETAWFPESIELAAGLGGLPIGSVPGLTLGRWLQMLRNDPRCISVRAELQSRHCLGVQKGARLDDLSSEDVIELLRSIPGIATSVPWGNAAALDQAYKRARDRVLEALKLHLRGGFPQ